MAAHLNFQQHLEKKIQDIFGLKPDIVNYLSSKCSGYVLDSSCLCEDDSGLTVTLKYKIGNSRNLNHDKLLAGKHQKKRKPPSRLKRDRARLLAFKKRKLETKNKKQLSSNSNFTPSDSQTPHFSQCPPPQDESITIPNRSTVSLSTIPPPEPPAGSDDSWTTVDSEEKLPLEDVSPEPTPNPAPNPESEPSPPHAQPITQSRGECFFCSCSVPRYELSDLYEECSVCLVSASEAPNGIKPCARCLSSAYCSKKCQSLDWKEHKSVCFEELGVRVRKARQEILDRKNQALELQRMNCPCTSAT